MVLRRPIPFLCSLSLAVRILLGAAPAGAGVPLPWDLREVDRAGQWTIYNGIAGGAAIGFPLATGDMNRDGRADLILTPMIADSGPRRDRDRAGEAAIVFSTGTIAGERDLAQLNVQALPPDVMLVYGADALDYLGTQVDAADLDGDGYADAIIGAQYGDGASNARSNSGEVVIVWGGPDLGGQALDLAAPPAGAVTFVYGAASAERLGAWVSSGDVDGDGIADAVLGADQASPTVERFHAGKTYVVYGGAALRAAAAVDLATPSLAVTVIAGIDMEDHSGATVRAADLNRDGAAEVVIGAGLNRLSGQVAPVGAIAHGSGGGDGPNNICDSLNFECNIGEAYIVYGQPGVRPTAIDLADPPASPAITTIYGIDDGDAYGEELYGGDFNGDGWGDVAVGAITADGPANVRGSAGEVALVLGGPTLAGSVVELANPSPNLTIFYGRRAGAIAGDTAMLLDLDGDGRDDLVIAAPNDHPRDAPPPGVVEAGKTFVIFGTAEPLPAAVDLRSIPDGLSHLVIDGADPRDMLAYSMGRGDVSGDGLPDLVLNVMGGDGLDNHLVDAGDAYVLDAVELTHAAGREVVATRTPTLTPTVTPTPVATSTATSTSNVPTATATPSSITTASVTPSVGTCAGDCDGGGEVSIDELIRAVRIALGELPASACTAVDTDASGTADIGELVAAVARSLSGC